MTNLKDQKRPAITSFNTMAPTPAPRSESDRRTDRELDYQREKAEKGLAAIKAGAKQSSLSQN